MPRLFTVRTMVLLVVVSIAFVLVFPTLRSYLDQQVRLQALRAEVAAAEQRNDDLQAELDRWSDPAYVEAQARERLAFVMPGERALRVADPETATATPVEEHPEDEATGPVVTSDPNRPWYAQIWDSVQVAGVAGTEEAESTDPEQDADPEQEAGADATQDGATAGG